MNAPDSHGGWNKVSGKLNRFIDFDNALTHHRDFVFGVLGVTDARFSNEIITSYEDLASVSPNTPKTMSR